MASCEGGIFEGIKFWLAQRIPSRPHFKALIQENGGTVVDLDKNADILIADHLRRDCPPNSFSWRFIEESVKEGRLLDKEDYPAGRPSRAPRPVASREVTKGQRSAFTTADDMILAAWATKSDHAAGNKIYQELEANYPHHPWQSWRNRWVRTLSFLSPDVLERMAANAPVSGNELPTSTPAVTDPRPRPRRQAEPAPSASPRPSTPPRRSSQPVRRREEPTHQRAPSPPYTSTDDDVLERHVRAMVEKGKLWNSRSIYEELAKKHPHHSATSWQARFAERWRDRNVSMRDWNSNRPPNGLRSGPTEDDAADQRITHSGIRNHGRAHPGDLTSPGGSPEEEEPEKARFYKDLDIFIETDADGGKKLKIKRRHRFQGVTFELWDLYQTVLAQNCPVDDVDWELVAEDMGLDWVAGPEVAELLEGCWDKYLGKFHELTAGFAYNTQEMGTVEVATSEPGEEVEEGIKDEDDVGEEIEVEEEAEEEVEEEVEEPADENDEDTRVPLGDEEIEAEIEDEEESEEEDAFEKPSTRALQDQRRRHTMPALRERDYLLPSSPPVRGLPRPAHLGQSSPTLTDRHRPTATTLLLNRKRHRFSRHSEIPSTPDSQIKPRAAAHDAETQRKRRKLVHAEDITMEPEPEEEEDDYITPSRKPAQTGADKRASSSLVRRTVEPGSRVMGTAVRRRTTTTGVTKETIPVSSPHALRPRGVGKKSQRQATPQPERDASPPPTNEPEREGEEDNSDEVFAAIERFEAQGYGRETVIEGLYRTSMDPSRAGLVMQSLKSGKGVPKNTKGVWTVRDDERLKAVDSGGRGVAKMRDTLLKKHGAATVDARRRFLADAEEIGFSL